MITGTARWYTVGSRLVTATRAGLTAGVARAGQVPGEIAWDDCNCDGVLAVTMPRVFLSELFPDETEGPVGARCWAPYEVAEFTVAVVRCAPQPQGQKLSPPVADLDSAAGLLLQDIAETMDALSALMCQMKDADDVSDYLITPAESAGPEGACVGFSLRVLVSLERS
jgi:hypothetical protein